MRVLEVEVYAGHRQETPQQRHRRHQRVDPERDHPELGLDDGPVLGPAPAAPADAAHGGGGGGGGGGVGLVAGAGGGRGTGGGVPGKEGKCA